MTFSSFLRRLVTSVLLLYIVGVVSLFLAMALILMHVREITAMKEQALPLFASLPVLERRLAILKEQVEVAELDASLRMGSQMERVRVFVLPPHTALDRAITLFDVLQSRLTSQGLLSSMSSIEVGESVERGDGMTAIPLTVHFAARGEGVRSVLSFLRIAGLLTVGDALTRAEKSALIKATEEENPTGIVALEQFLATDLLSYAKEPRPFEEQLKRSLSSDGFAAALRTVLDDSLLKDARALFQGDLLRDIERYRLWPMQFMEVKDEKIRPGASPDWYRLDVTVQLLERASD